MQRDNIFLERKIMSPSKERLMMFYREQKYTDCTFIVGDKKFGAHKLVLACCSTVFEAMFFQFSSNEIEICDIRPSDFKQALDFIYLDNIEIESMSNAWSIFYIANKYLIDSLRIVCLDYINSNISMDNLVMCYEYAEMYNLAGVQKRCFSDINNYLKAVFRCGYHMKPSTLSLILQKNLFRMDSYELVINVLVWAVDECSFKNINIEPRNVITILEEEQILKFVKKRCIFRSCGNCGDQISSCECCGKVIRDTLLLIASTNLDFLDEEIEESRSIKRSPVCRLRKVYKIAGRIDLVPDEPHVTLVTVEKDILIFGLLLTTVMNPGFSLDEFYEGSITVKIVDTSTNFDVMKANTTKDSMPYDDEYYVNFKNLAKLCENTLYKIMVCFENFSSPGSVSSIHSHYMSNPLNNDNNDCSVNFEEPYGSVVRGITYYPY